MKRFCTHTSVLLALLACPVLATAAGTTFGPPPAPAPATTFGPPPAAAPATTFGPPPAAAPATTFGPPPAATVVETSPAPVATTSPAQAPVTAADTRALDEEIQAIKKELVDLNRDLFVLEEELLFPANTQVAVFLSMDVGDFFALDTVELRVDNKQVAKYLYTAREAEALLKGGVQRLYLGNLRVGNHELVALFTGKGPNGQDYTRGAQLKFEKSVGAKYLELKIADRQRKRQPEFEIKDWE
jgi:hypothetical protein